EDAVGDILSQTTTKLTVPAGNYPVVLPMYSSLLSNAVFTGTDNYLAPPTFAFVPTFSMTTFTYSGIVPEPNYQFPPYALTLTTVDPQATITSVTVNGTPVSPSGTTYALPSLLLLSTNTIIIVVTAADGGTHTYTMTFLYNAG
ncbi:MAG: cadherin-like beta sandwich domain-containing protein, partial [Spirochaetia bacterium]